MQLFLRSILRIAALTLCAACIVPAVLASKNFVKPEAKSAINYPAHDFHRDEQVAIAADPYDSAEKAKIFSVNFADHGYLPIFFIVTNDGDQPVSIANMRTWLPALQNSSTPELPAQCTQHKASRPRCAKSIARRAACGNYRARSAPVADRSSFRMASLLLHLQLCAWLDSVVDVAVLALSVSTTRQISARICRTDRTSACEAWGANF